MQPRVEAFHEEMCQEHLDEASFLYDHRIALTWDLEYTWPEQAEQEAKFEAHLDALFAHGQIAWQVMRETAAPTDSGELYTALCFYFRGDSPNDVAALIPDIDYEEETVTTALVTALVYRCPDHWADHLAAWADEHEAFLPFYCRVAARRGFAAGNAVAALRERGDWATYADCMRLINAQAAAAEIFAATKDSDAFGTRFAAATTLMRAAHQPFLEAVMQDTNPDAAGQLTLALMGSSETHRFLLNLAQTQEIDENLFLAMALLGDPRVCPFLIQQLEAQSDWAEAAANALNTLLGGFFTEEVWVEETLEDDELFEEEYDARYAEDEDDDEEDTPRPPHVSHDDEDEDEDDDDEDEDEQEEEEEADEEPQGEEVNRLSQDPAVWREHLQTLQLQDGLRYRYGQPATPLTVVTSLFEPRTPNFMRELILHECLIRYNIEIPLSVHTPVQVQIDYGHSLAAQLAQQGDMLPPGCWTYLNNPYQ